MSGYQVPPEQWNQQYSPYLSQSQPSASPQPSQPSVQAESVPQQQQQQPFQYSDGLEVVPPSDPEWVSNSGEHGGTHADALGQKIPVVGGEQYKKYDDGTGANGAGATALRPWYKRKAIIVVIAAVVILAIGLGVGLGVGLTVAKGGNGDSDGSDSADK